MSEPTRKVLDSTTNSATERLRALLDERGVDHESTEWIDGVTVSWQDSDGTVFCARESLSLGGPTGTLDVYRLTPSQAVAATLGRGTCEVECFDDGMDEGMDGHWFAYAPPTWHLSCGHEAHGQRPSYCPVCGRKVVE